MILLNEPSITYQQALEACIVRDKTSALAQKINSSMILLLANGDTYTKLVQTFTFNTLDLSRKSKESLVLSNLKTEEFKYLYNERFAKATAPAKYLYDELIASAKGSCPYCGGLGQPKNLDHFVPKSKVPQFSILPLNLIPSCRDCNMGSKGDNFSGEEQEQIIHPYLDKTHFFEEQWIFAKYIQNDSEPNEIQYYVNPPSQWSDEDKKRVLTHFKDFGLAERFSIASSSGLASTEAQIQSCIDKSIEDVKEVILTPRINQIKWPNSWEYAMLVAIREVL